MLITDRDIERLAYAFYSGVSWEKLSEKEKEQFLQYEKELVK